VRQKERDRERMQPSRANQEEGVRERERERETERERQRGGGGGECVVEANTRAVTRMPGGCARICNRRWSRSLEKYWIGLD
jgi:hypothetical protein